jgi:hypothetical protein
MSKILFLALLISLNIVTIAVTFISIMHYTVTRNYRIMKSDFKRDNIVASCLVFVLLIINIFLGIFIIGKIQEYSSYISLMALISIIASIVTFYTFKRRQGVVFWTVSFTGLIAVALLIVDFVILY